MAEDWLSSYLEGNVARRIVTRNSNNEILTYMELRQDAFLWYESLQNRS